MTQQQLTQLLKLIKTTSITADMDELSSLENYTYIWNIKGKAWLEEWQMNPKGFVSGENDEKASAQLEKLNKIRVKLITPLLNFKANFKGDTKSRIRAILKLFSDCDYKHALNL